MSRDSQSDADAAIVVTVHAEILLDAVSEGVERAGQGARATVVCCPDVKDAVAVLAQTQGRGGRGLPVLGLVADDDGAPALTPDAVALLTDAALCELHVAVPSFQDDATRRILWDQIRAEGIEERHQLVEVDGRTVLAADDHLPALAAAAAGILAGRMAVANRDWARRP